ncbi:MAG: CPBP family intramembrane glutamic endopeptidase [Pseudomonadota bacterium]
MALVREPMMAFFWVVLAPVLFVTGGAMITASIIPEFDPGTAQEVQAYHTAWLVSCLALALWFAIMSVWSEWLGAGPFAGEMSVEAPWIVIALIVGPMLLLIPSLVVGSFMSESDWQFRGEVNENVFAPANWSIAFIFATVLLAPIVEEVAFRGIGFGALIARGISPALAIVLSSAAFAFSHLHYSTAAMLVVFLTGVGLGILRLMSGTVIVPMVAHMAANANTLFLMWVAANPPT